MKNAHDISLPSGAIAQINDSSECEYCDEPFIFTLQSGDHSFPVGLSVLLECLKYAETENVIPPLPAEWWDEISTIMPIPSHPL